MMSVVECLYQQEKIMKLPESDAVGAAAMLAAIVDSSDDPIFSETLEGIITSWNRGAEQMVTVRPKLSVSI